MLWKIHHIEGVTLFDVAFEAFAELIYLLANFASVTPAGVLETIFERLPPSCFGLQSSM